jgi:antitoxin (DNA-binding transcriptional repressor) of toxin-antitoxin stability system
VGSHEKLSIREVRAGLPRLDDLLAEEGEVLIVRRGKTIACVLPARARKGMPSHATLRARMPRLDVGSEALLRKERDER